MKQFFKFVLATVVGIIVASLILVLIVVGVVVSASGDKDVNVEDNSVLTISLDRPIPERTPNNPLANLGIPGFDSDKTTGLNDLLANIKKAKTDKHIKGIYLSESYMLSGQATTEEIRRALIDFKKSGKFIIAYAEVYTQGFYYLASVADKVYMNPKGIFDFGGFSSQITFFKGALDKLGIEAQVIKVGTYKSAVEPFVLNKMSDANREQVNSYLGSLYDYFLTGISAYRHVPVDSLRSIANNLQVQNPEDAVKYKLIDGLKYKDEILDELKSRTGTAKKSTVKSVDIADYTHTKSDGDEDKGSSDKRIAVVYASGEISSGDGDDNKIGSTTISAALRKVRLDDKVKAVVFRVNSPGGSSLASAVIWREVQLIHQVKPIIISMGDYAASGGYYISCAADSIIAEPNTVTGSIGIFAILPNMQKLFNDKLGITFDGVKTGKYADLGDISRPLTPEERLILQNQVNRGYDEFTKAVADGRHKTQTYINSIGQGRVWTGAQAVKLGLVDRLGSINDAIASAAKKAKVSDYKVVAYPEQKNMFSKAASSLSTEVRTRMMQSELGENYRYYMQIKSVQEMMRTPQARLPYDVVVK
ncbi:signal peptide peptidase SppA [Mucilaginibacter sp. RS28]|uniref:Signal peptide peptidase SppA n=1 Tax=Mucilaginibacter straminoryzae TaxID=2932774 RepID=A0A9X2B8T0_9SPHI|nr:signal peptide peptidase SppA [Mucilaginibacter straminoryzae]MCJ8209954.1 signal peptide peptidase SppA [Mucilaginibacter straminoryzae]